VQGELMPDTRQRSLLLFGSQMETGGAQRVLLNQAEWFHAHGWRVDILFLYDKEGLKTRWEAELGMPVTSLEARERRAGKLTNLFCFTRGLLRCARRMIAGHYDIVESFGHHANLIGIPLAWLARVPGRVATHHGRILNFPRVLTWIHTGVINSALTTRLVVVSEKVRAEAGQEGVHGQKIVLVPNGIKLLEAAGDLDRRQTIRSRVRQEFHVSEEDVLVLSAGRMTYQKAHEHLLQAFSHALRRFPNTALLIAGDGPLHSDLERQAAGLGITDRVMMPGIRKDLPDLMLAADLFALSSRWEGLPMALLEAMGAGLAAVSTQVEGVEEVIKEGETGLLVPVGDSQALGDALVRLMDNAAERESIGAAGRRLVESEYTVDRMCSRYQDVFNRLLEVHE
jgi:glycosyltransferase involved in cell wall biosynthesis